MNHTRIYTFGAPGNRTRAVQRCCTSRHTPNSGGGVVLEMLAP